MYRRLAACLILRELAAAAPSIFLSKAREFLECVWPALRDRAPPVREAAAAALSGALALLAARNAAHAQPMSHFYCAIYGKAEAALGIRAEARGEEPVCKPAADESQPGVSLRSRE